LIIVDSIASLARKEFGGHQLITERNNMLMKEATLLKYVSSLYRIPKSLDKLDSYCSNFPPI